MPEFIKTQYTLYLNGQSSIGLEKIKKLAKLYLTPEEQKTLFG